MISGKIVCVALAAAITLVTGRASWPQTAPSSFEEALKKLQEEIAAAEVADPQVYWLDMAWEYDQRDKYPHRFDARTDTDKGLPYYFYYTLGNNDGLAFCQARAADNVSFRHRIRRQPKCWPTAITVKMMHDESQHEAVVKIWEAEVRQITPGPGK